MKKKKKWYIEFSIKFLKYNQHCFILCHNNKNTIDWIYRYCCHVIVWFQRLPVSFCVFTNRKLSVLDTTLCDKVCQWFASGRWFSTSAQVSSTNITDRHDITEILLKVALNTIILTQTDFLLIILLVVHVVHNVISLHKCQDSYINRHIWTNRHRSKNICCKKVTENCKPGNNNNKKKW
jgi:hypothetical protein